MKKDFEGIADFLHNGLEHSDIGEAKDHLYSEFGINKSVAHKMIDAWNGQDARKVLKYTLKDDIAWLKNFFDSNKDENMKLTEKILNEYDNDAEWSGDRGYVGGGTMYGLDDSEHTNDGYRLVPIDKKISAALNSLGLGSPKSGLEKIMVDVKGKIVTAKFVSGKGIEARFNDFHSLVDAGMIGFRFEGEGSKLKSLLYFKFK